MKHIKRFIIAVLVISEFLIFTGCWNYREIDTLLIVAGIAIDKGKNASGYRVTVDTIDVSSDGNKNAPPKSMFIESDGDTIFDAFRNILKVSSRNLYYSNCQSLIISKEIAEDGIAPVLDFIIRHIETRIDTNLMISREDSAQAVLMTKGMTDPITSYATNKAVANQKKLLAKAPEVPLYKAIDLLASNGISLVLPALRVKQNLGLQVTEVDGMALFKGDKELGFLSSDESKIFLIITNKARGGLFLIKEEEGVPDISLEIRNCKAIITPDYTSSKLRMKIDVQMQCSLGEQITAADFETLDGLKKIEQDASAQLRDRIIELVKLVQEQYASDIFGFGNKIYQGNVQYWQGIKFEWDKIFETLEVEVNTRVVITDTAVIKSRIKVGDSK